MNPNPTPEEMAMELWETWCTLPSEYPDKIDEEVFIELVAEAIQSAQQEASRQSQQRIEEAEFDGRIQEHKDFCNGCSEDHSGCWRVRALEQKRDAARQALNPKKEGGSS